MNSLIFPIVSIVAAIGLYFFFISPNLEEIGLLKEKDAEFSKSLDDVREIENIMAQLESSYAGITQEDLIKLERFIPVKLDGTQVANDLSALIESEGASLDAIAVSSEPKPAKGQDVDARLFESEVLASFFSDYDTFKKVLASLENNLQIARIYTAKMGSGTDDEFGLSKYEIGLIFYSYIPKE